jgi:prespore-specific regulator
MKRAQQGGMGMTAIRQDAWTEEEDLLLAEIVLRSVREGGTQLQAFAEASRQLSRTAAACGFRWNAYVRKQYREAIEFAKQQRKKQKTVEKKEIVRDKEIDLHDVITFLQAFQPDQQLQENKKLKREIEQLKERIEKLQNEKEVLEKQLQTMQQDYKSLINILERARQLSV